MQARHPESEQEACLVLHLIPGLGPRRLSRLVQHFGSAQAAYAAPDSAWRALGIPQSSCLGRHDAELHRRWQSTLAWLEQPQHHLLTLADEGYPALLAEVPDASFLIYVAGNVSLLDSPQIALVGSRQASHLGLSLARQFSSQLVQAGFAVTSGLALGIDGAAHQGALDAQGPTLAVLGTGLTRMYPKQHHALAHRILAEGGALVSEFPLDTPPVTANFPRRNRIISGLSLGVLVVEAGLASGSLITARLAAEQGREVFAIPGSIQHAGSRGCHQLIREGAVLTEGVEDIVQALQGWTRPSAALASISSSEEAPAVESTHSTHPVLKHLQVTPLTTEALAVLTNMGIPTLLAHLTELELDGCVKSEAGYWVLAG